MTVPPPAGYVFSQTDGYDVNWSTPHCVLTLKLIGVAFDMFDGHKDKVGAYEPQVQADRCGGVERGLRRWDEGCSVGTFGW